MSNAEETTVPAACAQAGLQRSEQPRAQMSEQTSEQPNGQPSGQTNEQMSQQPSEQASAQAGAQENEQDSAQASAQPCAQGNAQTSAQPVAPRSASADAPVTAKAAAQPSRQAEGRVAATANAPLAMPANSREVDRKRLVEAAVPSASAKRSHSVLLNISFKLTTFQSVTSERESQTPRETPLEANLVLSGQLVPVYVSAKNAVVLSGLKWTLPYAEVLASLQKIDALNYLHLFEDDFGHSAEIALVEFRSAQDVAHFLKNAHVWKSLNPQYAEVRIAPPSYAVVEHAAKLSGKFGHWSYAGNALHGLRNTISASHQLPLRSPDYSFGTARCSQQLDTYLDLIGAI